MENKILASRDVLDVSIIRPAILYGGDGTIFKSWLEPVRQASVAGESTASVYGEPTSPLTVVHKDDLADVYVRLVDQVSAQRVPKHPCVHTLTDSSSVVLVHYRRRINISCLRRCEPYRITRRRPDGVRQGRGLQRSNHLHSTVDPIRKSDVDTVELSIEQSEGRLGMGAEADSLCSGNCDLCGGLYGFKLIMKGRN